MSTKKAMTQEEVKELELQLEHLKTIKRKEVAEQIKTARSFGDLSENSEYDEAKNEQAMVEDQILQLEAMLKNVEIIDRESLSTDVVEIGLHIKLYDNKYEEELTYQIVASNSADPSKGKISDESPLGKELKGKKVGETVTVDAPGGLMSFKILEISK
ncbi:MAG: transcription elongation factor GreA [Oscillospiraceae bacterium]|nr:transcription elongation factor GreA [Oscillospiraceae bacterium]